MPFLKDRDISICYETFGDSSKPTVILVMGITGQLINWPSELVQDIANAGFHVISFDNRDVGLSTYYDDLGTINFTEAVKKIQQGEEIDLPYTLDDMASDLRVLMDGLHIEKAHIVGLSMGGQIAQCFAIQQPERLLSLTLIATSSGDPGLSSPKPEVLDFFFKPIEDIKDRESAIKRHIKQYQLYNHPDDFDQDEVTALHEKAYKRAYHPEGNQRQLSAMMVAKPRGTKLRSVLVPSLVIHGDYDPIVPMDHGKQLAKLLPNSTLLIIENMGHGIPKRICKEVADAVIKHFGSVAKYCRFR